MTPDGHVVRARLRGGWSWQTLNNAAEAAALFDRLRRLNPLIELERLADGRVVELRRPPQPLPSPALLAAVEGHSTAG